MLLSSLGGQIEEALSKSAALDIPKLDKSIADKNSGPKAKLLTKKQLKKVDTLGMSRQLVVVFVVILVIATAIDIVIFYYL